MLLLALFCWSCGRPAPSSRPASGPTGAAPGDTLEVDSKAVVFFRQDSARLARIRAVLKDRLYESLTHDCLFEGKYARSVIRRERPALTVMDVAANRWLVFRKKDGGRKTIDLNAINDLCGVFLFDGIKDPMRADMPNIETQLWFYFGDARN